jgi:hypothetical protein
MVVLELLLFVCVCGTGFEFRVSFWWDRQSIAWAMLSALQLLLLTYFNELKFGRMTSKVSIWLGTVAQTCNPSFLGGRNQEDHSSSLTWAKSSQDPSSTNGRAQWGTHLSPQLRREAQIGGSRSRLTWA